MLEEEAEKRRLKKIEESKEAKSEGKYRLELRYKRALKDKKEIQEFIDYSKNFAKENPFVKEYAFRFADYSTKLLIKSMKKRDFGLAQKVLDNYIDNLLPFAGLDLKSSDVASNGIVLGIVTKNDEISDKVFEKILGPDFLIQSTDNNILLFNLACYYATHNEKDNLLQATRQALYYGKEAEQFLSDGDFKPYLQDKDFTDLFTKPLMKDTREVDAIGFELRMKLSSNQFVELDTRYETLRGLDKALPIYELLHPKHIKVSLSAWNENHKSTMVSDVSDVAIEDLLPFLKALSQSINLPVGAKQSISTLNDDFAFGISRESQDSIILYNARHKVYHKGGVYDEKNRIDYATYAHEVQKLLSLYNSLQESLESHIYHYLHDPIYTKEVDGLSISLVGKKLFYADEKNHLFQVELKNVSDKSIFFIDNMDISIITKEKIYISIRNKPTEDANINELKAGENITLDVKADIAFVKEISLYLSMQNSFERMTAMMYKIPQNCPSSERFSHTWQGQISSEIAVFTLKNRWQEDVGTKEDFDTWVARFKPYIIE